MKYKFLIIISFYLLGSCSYLPSPIDLENSSIEENTDFIILTSLTPSTSNIDILFYPGGLVDPHAYILALDKILPYANTIFIAKHDANLAVLDSKKAESFLDLTNTLFGVDRKKVIIGHSLGGAMACSFLSDNLETFDAAILMASYPTENFTLKDYQGSVLSITASNDQVLDLVKFEEAKAFLPPGETVIVIDQFPSILDSQTSIFYDIEGGNHGQFGSYGEQSGDGTASISEEDQQTEVKELIIEFFNAKGWL